MAIDVDAEKSRDDVVLKKCWATYPGNREQIFDGRCPSRRRPCVGVVEAYDHISTSQKLLDVDFVNFQDQKILSYCKRTEKHEK